jgi:DNA-binding transcriptional LysR family regulator
VEALSTSALEKAFRSGLKLGHLRILSSLARVGRVSRVAELFNVTQPAISKQLGELESLLGTPVVARSGRRVVLTPAGEILVKHGRQVLYTLEAARREIEDLQEGLAGTVRVGAVATVMPTLVAAGVVRLRQRAPAVTITLFEATTDNLFPLVREGRLDLVVSRTRMDRIKAEQAPLEERLVGVDPLVIVCAGQNPLAGRKSLRWADLASQAWVLPPEGSAIHDGLTQLFEKHGLRVGPGAITANSIAALPRLLADGQFIGLMPRAYAQEYVDRRVLAILPLTFSRTAQEVRAVWRREQETPALRLFLQSLAEAADFPVDTGF